MKVMRTTVATVVAATLSMSAFSVFAEASLTGAGATFPAPVYAKWADTYQKETGNKVNYQGIGSSGGVKQIIANTVDFGASDAPLPGRRERSCRPFHAGRQRPSPWPLHWPGNRLTAGSVGFSG